MHMIRSGLFDCLKKLICQGYYGHFIGSREASVILKISKALGEIVRNFEGDF